VPGFLPARRRVNVPWPGLSIVEQAMMCASFIWEPGASDPEFERLNADIDAVANALRGFLGVDAWVARDGARRCVNHGQSVEERTSCAFFKSQVRCMPGLAPA
jgi:hypothetical protein